MRSDSTVDVLLERAVAGAEPAWRELVARYSPLVFRVCYRAGVTGSDAEDVAGNVWLRLVTNLPTIREPRALPKWLITTAERECGLLRRQRQRQVLKEDVDQVVPGAETSLLGAERGAAVREAVAGLSDRDKQLLALLFSDPPTPYATISSRMGVPVGAIGPMRQRCLARLRRLPAIAALWQERYGAGSHVSHPVRAAS
ncbi:RNA polymerase sigma factor [Actinophytocola xanthii]|uniref:RNA polymerase sigma-70 region 2 domain-containing protein n=1 Tax=Actinophytocola xanthii TaxID=1912961 RepID=A0A1Q8CY09_9PSEU|nr:sigma-70 family RNA polymerase sigma factor [Actinophytocola xanthii]OLF19248.1 hypothetical protein BU204_02540 [Actinophytocola xanthii]